MRPNPKKSNSPETFHRFIDEMGDPTFYGKGRRLILGQEGVSLSFGLGIVKIQKDLETVRNEVREIQKSVENDPLFNTIPSVKKRIENGGFFFHACKDTPDVRSPFLHYLRNLDCEAEIVIARKIPSLFEQTHLGKEDLFYADLLSHLIKSRTKRPGKLVLNIAERGSSTRDKILDDALRKAIERAEKKWPDQLKAQVVFNVQTPLTEPLLNIADYICWSVQRVFERGDIRHYEYLKNKIRLVVDLYDRANYAGFANYYDNKRNPLTPENKLGPHLT
jgi:predicted GNAT family N-acyltransferase